MATIYTCYITSSTYKDFHTLEELQVIKKRQFDKLIMEVEEYPIVTTQEEMKRLGLVNYKSMSAEEEYLDCRNIKEGFWGLTNTLMKLRILMAKRHELNDDGTELKIICDELADKLEKKIINSILEITEEKTLKITAKITVGK